MERKEVECNSDKEEKLEKDYRWNYYGEQGERVNGGVEHER